MGLMRWRPWDVARREQRGAEWDPWADFRRMREEMDRLFEGMISQTGLATGGQQGMLVPAVDVYEADHEIVVKAELPGVSKDQIDVNVTSDALVLQAEQKDEQETQEEGYYRRERRYGKFYRTVPLPEGVKTEEAKANFKDGVLEIRLPRSEETKKSSKVTIE